MGRLDTALHAYRDGAIGFDELAKRTAGDWRRLAKHLLAKWQVPSTVTADDVRQELLLGCWQHVGRWDPLRGVTLSRYVVWNACALATAFLHRQRNAYKRRDTSLSRHPVVLSLPAHRERPTPATDVFDRIAPDELLTDRNIGRIEAIDEALGGCGGELARECVLAFVDAGGDTAAAAAVVFDRDDRFGRMVGRAMVRQAVEAAAHAG